MQWSVNYYWANYEWFIADFSLHSNVSFEINFTLWLKTLFLWICVITLKLKNNILFALLCTNCLTTSSLRTHILWGKVTSQWYNTGFAEALQDFRFNLQLKRVLRWKVIEKVLAWDQSKLLLIRADITDLGEAMVVIHI